MGKTGRIRGRQRRRNKKGIVEGRKEGENNKKLEIAKKMKEKGMDYKTIIELTQVTDEELKSL